MGAACCRATPADRVAPSDSGSGQTVGKEDVQKGHGSKVRHHSSSGDLQSAVDKSMAKREKSVHLDTVTRRNNLSIDLTAAGRTFHRNSTLELERMTPPEALQELLNGNARFILGESQQPHQDFKRLAEIAPKQHPFAAVLACADSRAPVEIVFDQGFGDIFCCRIAGNIAAAEEVASLEYAVLELGVKVIMVMGHTSCGAVKAACSGKAFPGFIDILVNDLDVAVTRAQAYKTRTFADLQDRVQAFEKEDDHHELIERVIRENVLYQLDRCRRSTIILEAVKNGTVLLVPALYDIETGEVEVLH